jgi:surface polysaccharide O-acyltransferase-like enzyme
MASRDVPADCLKAAAITAVVAIHMPGGSHAIDPSLRFCVPVFIGLWGYYAEASTRRHPEREMGTFLRHRFWHFLIPYAVWTVVAFVIGQRVKEWNTTPLHTIIGGWFGGALWAGQYFFIVLFQLLLLFPLLRATRPEAFGGVWLWGGLGLYALFEFSLVRVLPLALVWDRLALQWLPYAALGIALARGWRPPLALPSFVWAFVGIVLLAVAPIERAMLLSLGPVRSSYCLMTVYLGSLALLAAVLPSRETDWLGGRLLTAVTFVGQRTMPIFVLNPVAIHTLTLIGLEIPPHGVGPQAMHAVAVAVVIALCIAAIPVFQIFKLGSAIGA